MRYLIVGATSVFGEPLVDILLLKKTTEAITATRLEGEEGYSRGKLSWYDLDLRNADNTKDIIEKSKADVIFDFATQDSVGYSWENPNETVDVNVIGTINLLNAIHEVSPQSRVVIGGSGEEYGNVGFNCQPVTEDTTPRPVNIFGATKACQTMFARLYARAYGMDIVILRTFNETSLKQDDRFAISSFCHQFADIKRGKQEPVVHVGNINNIRAFTDVNDLAQAFADIAEKGKSGEIYNAASSSAMSLKDVIERLEQITGINVEIRMESAKVRPIDSPSVTADVSKIRSDTGWEAKTSIGDTLESLVKSWS